MKTLYMETTKKTPEQTAAEIQRALKDYNLKKFIIDYENGETSGCIFSLTIKINGEIKEVPIRLPIKWKSILKLAESGKTKYIKSKDQALRTAWRIAFKWIQSQLAYVDSEMVDIAEVFLSYMMVDKKNTLYQHMVENNMKLIESGGNK